MGFITEYVKEKKDAWNRKNGASLAYDNPILHELKWTGEHFGDLYKIATGKKKLGGKSGLITALKYDAAVTNLRHEVRKIGQMSLREVEQRTRQVRLDKLLKNQSN